MSDKKLPIMRDAFIDIGNRTIFNDVVDAYEAAPLRRFSTKELVDELTKREGVQELNVPDPDHGYTIHIYGC